MNKKYTLEYIKEKNLLIHKSVRGSRAYGTETPTSDWDYAGVFVAEKEDLYSGDYPDQVNDELNDIVYYELGKFLSLVETNNPNILELLACPIDMVQHETHSFRLIKSHISDFLTKQCKNSFGGYAKQQIKKANGMAKMQNWEQDKVTRKTPLDFCYVIDGHHTKPLIKILEEKDWNQKFCGLAKIPNARDMYSLSYDAIGEVLGIMKNDVTDGFMKQSDLDVLIIKDGDNLYLNGGMVMKYKGIIKEDGKGELVSNQLRLSSIPKEEEVHIPVSYNQDGYIAHCRDYKRYTTWLEERNTQRWVDVKAHGQKAENQGLIDGKNLMHLTRLVRMAKEIGSGQGIHVRRDDAQELLDIRHGKVDLKTLLSGADDLMKEVDKAFDESDLPDKVDHKLINDLLIRVRRLEYKEISIGEDWKHIKKI